MQFNDSFVNLPKMNERLTDYENLYLICSNFNQF